MKRYKGGETWYDLNDGIVLSTLWVKKLFKLVERKAEYLGLNTTEVLCTNK